MKKIFFFVLVIFLLLLITNTKALNRYRGSKEVKVVVSFTNSSVTTNDINEKMLFDYKVISYKPKLVLSYCDESILKKLNDFTFTDIEEGRKRYLEILRQYGLYSDIEKIECFGIPLASVTIYNNINNINKIKYESKIVKKS